MVKAESAVKMTLMPAKNKMCKNRFVVYVLSVTWFKIIDWI